METEIRTSSYDRSSTNESSDSECASSEDCNLAIREEHDAQFTQFADGKQIHMLWNTEAS